jgi:predicted transcriptional regulator
MNTLEIKNELLRLLTETDDVQLLDKVRCYFKILKQEPVTDAGRDAQFLAEIEIGLQQIERGEVISHDEVKKRIEERLRKRQQSTPPVL